MSAGAVHRRLWTSLCSCGDLVCSPGQGRLHARCVNDWCFGFTVQKTVEFPQLHVDVSWCSSSTVVDVPVLTQRRGLQFLDKVFGLPVVQRQVLGVDSAVLFIVRVLDIPVMPLRQVRTVQTVQLVSDSTGAVLGVVDMPVVVLDKCMIQTVLKTAEFAVGVVAVPVVVQRQVPGFWSRQC